MREGLKRGFETFFVNGTKTCFNGFKKIQIVSIWPNFAPKKGIRTQYDEISETIGRILGLVVASVWILFISLKRLASKVEKNSEDKSQMAPSSTDLHTSKTPNVTIV